MKIIRDTRPGVKQKSLKTKPVTANLPSLDVRLPLHQRALRMNALSILLLSLAVQAPPEPKPADIDYEARLNDILAKGITPEKNANVLIWQALGPTPEGGKPPPAEFFKRLGIPQPPEKGEYFIGTGRYLRNLLKLEPNAVLRLRSEGGGRSARTGGSITKPAMAGDNPRIAEWLRLNEKPLALIIEATKRPQYYSPVIARRKDGSRGSLVGRLMPAVQKCRELAAALNSRAMLRIAEGKFDAAWQDLLAIHRLGRLSLVAARTIDAIMAAPPSMESRPALISFISPTPTSAKQIAARLDDLARSRRSPPWRIRSISANAISSWTPFRSSAKGAIRAAGQTSCPRKTGTP